MQKINKTQPSKRKINLAGRVVIVDGKYTVRLNSPAMYDNFLRSNCKDGDYITLEVSSKRPKRTIAQNNFFHQYLSLIALSSGHTIDELKAWVKGKVLTKGITEVFGDKVRVVKSTADLNISEFLEMMDRIEEITGIPIPDSNAFTLALTIDEYADLKQKQKERYMGLVIDKKSGIA